MSSERVLADELGAAEHTAAEAVERAEALKAEVEKSKAAKEEAGAVDHAAAAEKHGACDNKICRYERADRMKCAECAFSMLFVVVCFFSVRVPALSASKRHSTRHSSDSPRMKPTSSRCWLPRWPVAAVFRFASSLWSPRVVPYREHDAVDLTLPRNRSPATTRLTRVCSPLRDARRAHRQSPLRGSQHCSQLCACVVAADRWITCGR